MRGKKILKGVGYVFAVLIAARIVAAFIWPTLNDVQTGKTPEYADLQPQHFHQPLPHVFAAALATAQAAGWELTAQDAAQGEIRAVATTRLWHFKDDISVTLSAAGEDTQVNLRSHSRIGKGDLGANARRIREFQAALAARLQ